MLQRLHLPQLQARLDSPLTRSPVLPVELLLQGPGEELLLLLGHRPV